MSLCKHRHVLPFVSIILQLLDEFFDHRVVNLVECILDCQGYTCVVDVLTGQTEVDELLVLLEIANLIEFFLDEVLHGFHVVVGYLLDVLHSLCVSLGEVGIYLAQGGEEVLVEGLQLRQRKFAKCNEIFNLHLYAVFYQRVFGEVVCKIFCLAMITAIDRRYSRKCIKFHLWD